MKKSWISASLFVLAFIAPCSLRAGLSCETWLTLGTAIRYENLKITEITRLGPETPEILPINGGLEPLQNFTTEKFKDSRAIFLITASGRARADHAYFKVYADWGEVKNRSINDLWLGVGYWMDFFHNRFHVVPDFGVTTCKQRAMDAESVWAGIDLIFDVTKKTSVWTELSYHFARFRPRQRDLIEFHQKKGHAVVAKFGMETKWSSGWFGGTTLDLQDWMSSDSRNLKWCVITAGAHFGYYF